MKRPRKSNQRKKNNLRKLKRPLRSRAGRPLESKKKQTPESAPPASYTTELTPQAVAPQQARIKAEADAAAVKEAVTQETGKEPTEDAPKLPESQARTRTIERLQRMTRAEQKRREALRNNKEWVWETYRLQFKLEPFVQNNPDQLKQFFTPTFVVTAGNFQAVKNKINKIENAELRALLERYARYALRYGVVFTLQKSEPHFRNDWIGYGLNKFHVAIRKGKVAPIGKARAWEKAPPLPRRVPSEDFELVVQTPTSDDLETDEVDAPAGLKSLVEEGGAKYVRIKDEDDSSLLRQIADFAYSPDQVTVIDYDYSLGQMRFLLVGEHVPLSEMWPKLRGIVASYQRDYAKHDQRGKDTDTKKLKAYLKAIIRRGDSLKNIAVKFVEPNPKDSYSKRFASMESHLSQLKKKLQE
jgi:hypothetical protein